MSHDANHRGPGWCSKHHRHAKPSEVQRTMVPAGELLDDVDIFCRLVECTGDVILPHQAQVVAIDTNGKTRRMRQPLQLTHETFTTFRRFGIDRVHIQVPTLDRNGRGWQSRTHVLGVVAVAGAPFTAVKNEDLAPLADGGV